MQPMATTQGADLLVSASVKQARSAQPVNGATFSKLEDSRIKPDDVFFHKYFGIKTNGLEEARKRKAKNHKSVDDEEPGEDDENEDEIWRALIDSRPELEEDDIHTSSSLEDFELDTDEEAGEEGNLIESISAFEPEGSDAYLDSDEVMSISDIAHFKEYSERPADQFPTRETPRAKKRRKLLKDLPTFASADEYAALLVTDS